MEHKITLKLMAITLCVITLIIISACSSSESSIQTAIAETITAKPTFTATTILPTITPSPTQTPSPTNTNTPTFTNTATFTLTPAARPSSLTFLEIENNYYDMMEDEPWNNYRATLKGVKVQWTGMILDKVWDTLLLDMGQYASDRMIALHKVPTVTVDKLNIGDSVTFIAEITDVTYYCDVQLYFIEMK